MILYSEILLFCFTSSISSFTVLGLLFSTVTIMNPSIGIFLRFFLFAKDDTGRCGDIYYRIIRYMCIMNVNIDTMPAVMAARFNLLLSTARFVLPWNWRSSLIGISPHQPPRNRTEQPYTRINSFTFDMEENRGTRPLHDTKDIRSSIACGTRKRNLERSFS